MRIHDQIEVFTMTDLIAVLNEGNIVQVGTPNDIYYHPATTFVAQLEGTPRIYLHQTKREKGSFCVKGSSMHLLSAGDNPSGSW
jgi:ABC-type sugar transport system ATPase subunit